MIRQKLQRTFWSIYGRFLWEKHQPPWKHDQIASVVHAIKHQSQIHGERVLDAGCGTGEHAAALANAGFAVVGVDYAPGMLLHAGKKIEPELLGELSFQQASLDEQLPFEDSAFDHVINISVLQAVADPMFTLQELRRVLRPDGTLFLLHVPKPDSHDRPLREVINYRIRHYDQVNLAEKLMIATKAWGDRTSKTRYWTVDEVKTMLKEAGFAVFAAPSEPVIMVHARKLR